MEERALAKRSILSRLLSSTRVNLLSLVRGAKFGKEKELKPEGQIRWESLPLGLLLIKKDRREIFYETSSRSEKKGKPQRGEKRKIG